MKKLLFVLAAVMIVFSLCACSGAGYSKEDLAKAKADAYDEGYEAGRNAGYYDHDDNDNEIDEEWVEEQIEYWYAFGYFEGYWQCHDDAMMGIFNPPGEP